ncbi:MAG: NAD(P)H-dependent oxidoreductase [Desulfovibrionaceae bacterium]|nr:NAD(P)H-dependent oxidoreductase [Desulfovibrionaceae bacterium]
MSGTRTDGDAPGRGASGHDASGREDRPTRRGLLFGAGAAGILAAAAGLLVPYLASTSPVKVENFKSAGDGRKKRILVLTGSAREGGNTELLARAFAEGAREAGHKADIFAAADADISACRNCGSCWQTGGPCVMEDGFEVLRPLLEAADMLVFASPLYWYNFSGHIKCVMDRLYPYTRKNRPVSLAAREAMLLMCGESRLLRSFAGPAEAYRQMLGYLGWKDRGRLFVTGVNDFGAMRGKKALATAREMGRTA